jgi:hypothetical protein
MIADFTEQEVVSSEEVKSQLMEQIQQKRESNNQEKDHALQEREADEVYVRQDARDGQQMGEGVEEEEDSDDSEQEEKRKSFQFQIDDDFLDIDENATMEIKADGKTVKMTLRELRDAAAGGVAVRNRMRVLSEERKKLYEPYKNFNKLAESDPLSALKKVFYAIKQVDPKADVNKFLSGLGKQAQSLSRMSPSERKAYSLERELNDTRETLTESERLAKVQEMKQELIGEMGLSEEQILTYGQNLLSNPTLAEGIRNEEDLFDRIADLADEVQRQQAVVSALHKYDSKLKKDDPLVFELSSILEKNPDFDEDDLNEIAEKIILGVKKSNAARVLSKRNRSKVLPGRGQIKSYSKMTPKEALRAQILEKRKSHT